MREKELEHVRKMAREITNCQRIGMIIWIERERDGTKAKIFAAGDENDVVDMARLAVEQAAALNQISPEQCALDMIKDFTDKDYIPSKFTDHGYRGVVLF